MAYKKQMDMVMKLVNLTNSGAIDWKPSVNKNMFQVSFRDNTLRIALKASRTSADSDIEIQLLNGSGELVESFTDVDLGSDAESQLSALAWFQIMSELYKAAQRTALGAEKVLDEIIADLDATIPF